MALLVGDTEWQGAGFQSVTSIHHFSKNSLKHTSTATRTASRLAVTDKTTVAMIAKANELMKKRLAGLSGFFAC